MNLKITTLTQYAALAAALEQYTENTRQHLEECAEEGERDPEAWAQLEAAQAYADQLAAVMSNLVD